MRVMPSSIRLTGRTRIPSKETRGKGSLLDIILLFMNSSSVTNNNGSPKMSTYSDISRSCHGQLAANPHQLRVIEALETPTGPFRYVFECSSAEEVESVAKDWPARRTRYLVEVILPSAPEDTCHECDKHTTEDGSPHGFSIE